MSPVAKPLGTLQSVTLRNANNQTGHFQDSLTQVKLKSKQNGRTNPAIIPQRVISIERSRQGGLILGNMPNETYMPANPITPTKGAINPFKAIEGKAVYSKGLDGKMYEIHAGSVDPFGLSGFGSAMIKKLLPRTAKFIKVATLGRLNTAAAYNEGYAKNFITSILTKKRASYQSTTWIASNPQHVAQMERQLGIIQKFAKGLNLTREQIIGLNKLGEAHGSPYMNNAEAVFNAFFHPNSGTPLSVRDAKYIVSHLLKSKPSQFEGQARFMIRMAENSGFSLRSYTYDFITLDKIVLKYKMSGRDISGLMNAINRGEPFYQYRGKVDLTKTKGLLTPKGY